MTEEQLLGSLQQEIARHPELEYKQWIINYISHQLSSYFAAKKTPAAASIANIIDEHL